MQQRRPGQRSCALCSVQHLAHRRPVQLLHSQVAQSGFVDPRTPPKTGKEANILHHHSWLLTGDFKGPAQRFHNVAHPSERLSDDRIIEQVGRFDIDHHGAIFGEQQIVGNVPTDPPTQWRAHHERLRNNMIHSAIEVRHQQPRQLQA